MFITRPIKIFGEALVSFTFSFVKALFPGASQVLVNFTIYIFIKLLKITKTNTKKQNAKYDEELLAFI